MSTVEGGCAYRNRLVRRQALAKKKVPVRRPINNPSANQGPSVNRTVSTPSRPAPAFRDIDRTRIMPSVSGGLTNLNLEEQDMIADFSSALVSTAAKELGDIVRNDTFKRINESSGLTGILSQKITEAILPKYDKDPKNMTRKERQEASYGLFENIPILGDAVSIVRSGEKGVADPSPASVARIVGETALSIGNPVGGAGPVKNIVKGISGWGSVRGARPKPPATSDWQEGFEPLDLNVNGRTGEMSSETYKTAKAHYGNDFPDAEIIGDYAYITPKLKGAVDKLLKELPSNLITPVSAKQIDKTSLDSIPRINSQYAKDAEASNILNSYGIQRVDPSVPPVTKETVDRMRNIFESDYGQAYRYDPVTGEKRITNNEHVFSVSVEALRHNFEIRQLEAAMKADKLGYLARQKKMQELIKKQKTEMEVALDPNQSMLILSEGTNQNIVGALPAKDKMRAIGEHDSGGAFGVTVPYRSGEERNWFPNMATTTVAAYQDIVNNAARNAPGLVDVAAEGFRSDYAKIIKPLRNSLQKSKDPKLIAALEKKIKDAEEDLYQKYYS